MTSNEFRQLLSQKPFKPFCVRLTSGEQVEVRRPYQAAFFEPTAVFGIGADSESGQGLRMRIVPVQDILSVEAA